MKTFLCLFILATVDPHLEYSPRELEEMRRTTENWRALVNQPLPDNDAGIFIDKLSAALRGSSASKDKPVSERGQLYFSLQEKLLSIPGHAEHHRDKINAAWQAVETAKESPDSGIGWGKAVHTLVTSQETGFPVLMHLPSPETVRVLGEFLFDDRGSELSREQAKDTGLGPNNLYAVSALSKIGLANPPAPPVRHGKDVTNNLESWQQWYSEIKSGRRTFRFIGDDTEYDLRGPVRRGGFDGGGRTAKRSAADEQMSVTKAMDKKKPSPAVPWMVALGMVLAGAGVWLWKRAGKI